MKTNFIKNNSKIILATSLALNVIFIGYHLGHAFGAFHHKPKAPFEREEKKIISILPQEKQENARQTFAKIREIHKNNFEQMHSHMTQVEEIVTAKDFNSAEFLKEFAKSDDMMTKMRQETNVELAKLLNGLNQEERQKIVREIKTGHLFGKKLPHLGEKKPPLTEGDKDKKPAEPNYKSSNDD